MSTMTRTDIHRPSAVEFDPENYEVFGFADFHTEDGYRPVQTVSRLVGEGWSFRGAPHGSGQCSHCGAHLRYAALMGHTPTKTLLWVGETCLGNRFEMTQAEFRAMQAKAAAKRQATSKAEVFAALCEETPALVWGTYAHNISVAGATEEWFLGWDGEVAYASEAEAQAAFENLQAWQQEPGRGYEPILRYKYGTTFGERSRASRSLDILSDLAFKARKWGSISEAQRNLATKLVNDVTAKAEALEAREADTAAKVAAGVEVPNGKQTVEGTVVSTKWQDNDFGSTLKMLVVTDEGWKVFGTVPSSIEVEKGTRVRFNATVSQSNNDPLFGFFKRPTKAQVL